MNIICGILISIWAIGATIETVVKIEREGL